MTEDSGRILDALDHLDPALVEDLDGPAGKRRPVPVRVLLAAACVGALLVVVAVAAEALGFDFVKILSNGEESEQGDSYRAGSAGLEYIPISELSPKLQELQEQYKDADFHMERLYFDSWEEAEEYVGHEISDNAVLAQSAYTTTITDEGNEQNICVVDVYIKYGEISIINVYAYYQTDWPKVYSSYTDIIVDTMFYIGEGPSPLMEQSDGYIMGFDVSNVYTVEGQEGYLAANGLETVIVSMKAIPGEYFREGGEYHAHFFLRGVRFMVQVHYSGPEEQETVLAGLKQVLDAFE